MFSKTALIGLVFLALVSLACGVTIDLPVTELSTGPTVTEEIYVPLPQDLSTPVELTLSFGAGELSLAPAADEVLVEGLATYNVKDLKPKVTLKDHQVLIESGDLEIRGIPKFSGDFKNEWDLRLGNVPMELRVNAGAYKGQYELGGLALRSLRISDGAAEVRLRFSSPNATEMDTFRYETGASSVELLGLANANFENLIFKSGAGDYTLDFSGELRRDATVNIDSGLSSITVIVPKGVSARVLVDGSLANVDLSGDWEKSGDVYILSGSGPRLTINVDIGAGSLTLRNK